MAQFFQDWFDALIHLLFPAAHEVERALARLRNARGHAGFQRTRAGRFDLLFDPDVHVRRDRGAVDEDFALRTAQQATIKDRLHRLVVGHYSDDDVRSFGDLLQFLGSGRA